MSNPDSHGPGGRSPDPTSAHYRRFEARLRSPTQARPNPTATRAEASLAYTMTMIGFAIGGVLVGWLADRYRITLPLMLGAVALGLGFVFGGLAGGLWQFSLAQGLLVGVGTSATFSPLIADVSLWFTPGMAQPR